MKMKIINKIGRGTLYAVSLPIRIPYVAIKTFWNFAFPVNELCFTALGPRGSGKTTLLACMCRKLEMEKPGTFYPASNDPKTSATLKEAYNDLVKAANSKEFSSGISATGELHKYTFTFLRQKNAVVRFFDFPGSWLEPDNINNEKVIEIIKRSAVILVAVNAPYIMEHDENYAAHYAGVDDIARLIRASLEENEDDKLVLLVPIKCEKYTKTAQDTRKMREKIKLIFQEVLGLIKNPVFKDRLAIALLPVHTVGCAEFKNFKLGNLNVPIGETYIKTKEYFSPKNVEQPLHFMLNFLLNQFERGRRQRILGLIFPRDKKKRLDIANFIRESMKLNDETFVIFGGGELIGGKGTPYSTGSIYPGDI